MRQDTPTIIDYRRPTSPARAKPIGLSFFSGWIIGTIGGCAAVAEVIGGFGMVVPMIFFGTLWGSLPVFALVYGLNRRLRFGSALSVVVGLVCSPCVSFGLLAAFIWSYHGC